MREGLPPRFIPLLIHSDYETEMTLQEKLYDLAAIDALPDAEELAHAFMDDPKLCYDAVVHYLHFRPDRWNELAKNYRQCD